MKQTNYNAIFERLLIAGAELASLREAARNNGIRVEQSDLVVIYNLIESLLLAVQAVLVAEGYK